ncbi:MAG TPA: 50S ribosomal protein L4 [bacterium]|nr:50S ribosomal protein L4 [bacterium]
MATLDIIDMNGKAVSTVEVDKTLADVTINDKVVRDAVIAMRANMRRGTAHTKIKKEINFSGEKPWRQKGTGRARSGERNSPLWRKGGIVFGPRTRDFNLGLPRKVKKSALIKVLADKLQQQSVIVLDGLKMEKPKTKDFIAMLGKIKAAEGALIVLARKDDTVEKSARNIPRVDVVHAGDLNTLDVLSHKKIVFTRDAFETVQKRLGK